MDKEDFIINEDNSQKIYLSEKSIAIIDILEKEYPYIYDSLNEEDLLLKSYDCSLFKELVFENKVVGFVSYDFSREFFTVALNNIYVLPKFRGNRLFLDELERVMLEHSKPSIIEPNRLIVELLIKYGFAKKIRNNIVASAIEFIIPPNQVISNKNQDLEEEVSTHFYDLNICSSIHILDYDNSHIVYNTPLNYDIIHYNCLENRYEANDSYFNEINQYFIENIDYINETISNLENQLKLKNYNLDEVIGPEEYFSDYMESLIDDAHLNHIKALKIKNQIKKEFEEGLISNESLLIRLNYLSKEKKEPFTKSHSETCPYCNMPMDSHDKFCHYCGINFDFKKYFY
ncbi:GNAT family N-acetyltransferase [Methanobrevibacter olleyae]|uniref:Uncharacterized protein n=1 Tax=Methanobrevibacter olleyae TaxID=294671 RepID=A0A126QYV0_METOL|nr:GNAT family N-acetyltransferase [Methanobrevibacter olleyae]AMK15330.1 hypothetical protein YLM1_0773 [Methanobrevibacter olleyae]SFL30129.1 hypothetical protein SAMN02910297_00516 [Methanobrevibacter olleyae]